MCHKVWEVQNQDGDLQATIVCKTHGQRLTIPRVPASLILDFVQTVELAFADKPEVLKQFNEELYRAFPALRAN